MIIECNDYVELTQERYSVGLLPSRTHEITISKCNLSTPLIVGGVKTKNGEYPHMAAIGYKTMDETIDFKCGGSLISERFVLTAAHCYRSNAAIVRLGDQNLISRSDGLIEVDVPIEKFIKHEKYTARSKYHDIALVKLSRDVK
jgi:secreted trypsin-like serine protease